MSLVWLSCVIVVPELSELEYIQTYQNWTIPRIIPLHSPKNQPPTRDLLPSGDLLDAPNGASTTRDDRVGERLEPMDARR